MLKVIVDEGRSSLGGSGDMPPPPPPPPRNVLTFEPSESDSETVLRSLVAVVLQTDS